MLHKLQRVLGLFLINLVVDEKVGGDALANDAAPVRVGARNGRSDKNLRLAIRRAKNYLRT